MLKYKFYKSIPFQDDFIVLGVIVEPPHVFMSQIFEGNETSSKIQDIINGVKRVKNKEDDDFFFRNESGFLADMDTEEEGVFIFDEFSEDPTKELLVVSFDEMLKLLEDYKKFLIENKR